MDCLTQAAPKVQSQFFPEVADNSEFSMFRETPEYSSFSRFVATPCLVRHTQQMIDGITTVIQQQSLRWHGQVLRKDENDCVTKCMDYELEALRHTGRPKRTWNEVTEKVVRP